MTCDPRFIAMMGVSFGIEPTSMAVGGFYSYDVVLEQNQDATNVLNDLMLLRRKKRSHSSTSSNSSTTVFVESARSLGKKTFQTLTTKSSPLVSAKILEVKRVTVEPVVLAELLSRRV